MRHIRLVCVVRFLEPVRKIADGGEAPQLGGGELFAGVVDEVKAGDVAEHQKTVGNDVQGVFACSDSVAVIFLKKTTLKASISQLSSLSSVRLVEVRMEAGKQRRGTPRITR